jgi:hypothetical protein
LNVEEAIKLKRHIDSKSQVKDSKWKRDLKRKSKMESEQKEKKFKSYLE